MRCLAGRCAVFAVVAAACQPAARADDEPSPPTSRPGAPARQAAAVDSLEAAIGRIRQRYAEIQRGLPRYRCRTLSLDGFSAEGGELQACYDGAALRKLTARYFGESGRAEEQYFVWGDHVDFVFRQTERYTAPLSGSVAAREEQRFYFVEGRLVRWIGSDDSAQPVTSSDAQDEATRLQATGRKFAACAADPAQDTCAA